MWQISYPLANGESLGSYNWGQSLSQTDRQIFWSPYTRVCRFFLSVKLPPYLLCSQGDNSKKCALDGADINKVNISCMMEYDF